MLLLVALSVLLVAVTVTAVMSSSTGRATTRRRHDALAQLGVTKLAVTGNPLDWFVLRGERDGVSMTIDNGALHAPPGPNRETMPVCVARFPLAMPDQLVCGQSDIDAVMGPFPTAPRVRTGHPHFDNTYAVFAPDAAESADYRSRPATWVRTEVLDALIELNLHWMRVRGGQCELAVAVLAPADAERLVDTVLAMRGAPVRAARAPRAQPVEEPSSVGLLIAWGVAAVLCVPLGMFASFLEPVRAMGSNLVCGPGGQLVARSCGDGSCLDCTNAPNRSATLHYFSCIAIVLGVIALIGMLLVARSRRAPLI